MYYKASLDKLSIAVSIAIAVLFLFIAIIMPLTFSVSDSYLPGVFSSVFFVLLYIAVWLYHPVSYEVSADSLIIKRPLNKVRISRAEIQSVRILEQGETRGTIRTFGVGGLFGYFGKFRNSQLGKMTWYVSNRNNMVLIKTNTDKVYVLSPDDTHTFIKEFGK